jgi:peptidyl-prolyl cis-trans isomerase B (cyclophilin B)
MKNKNIIITIIALILIVALLVTLCYGYYKKATYTGENPIATIEVENFGTITVELYPDMAPNTVANFIALANNGFYDGLTFHRIIQDFMIQGGAKDGDGSASVSLSAIDSSIEEGSDEDTDYNIKGEFIANGVQNTLKHEEGVISMARGDYTSISSSLTEESYNSASSQFFIVTKDSPSLNGYYAAFGKVIDGMDVVHEIEAVEVEEASTEGGEASTPVDAPVITSIKVDTKGIDYGMPETIDAFNYQKWLYSYYGLDY